MCYTGPTVFQTYYMPHTPSRLQSLQGYFTSYSTWPKKEPSSLPPTKAFAFYYTFLSFKTGVSSYPGALHKMVDNDYDAAAAIARIQKEDIHCYSVGGWG